MDEAVERVQEYLDETARSCLRFIVTRQLNASQYQRLAKFLFGCMNQKNELPRRVAERGPGELEKVLKFAALASAVLLEIDAQVQDETEPHHGN